MTYLAVDIGASSGKIVKGRLCNGRLETEVVHRFPNELKNEDGTLLWDMEALFEGIVEGLRKAGSADYVAIDTWGVDFVLLDGDGNTVGQTVSYRDSRTERLSSYPEQSYLYSRTGIQKQRFNTIYQLLSVQQEHPDWLDRAESMLFVPDYLAYRLTGVKSQEYTFASTSNLINPDTRDWDWEIIDKYGLPRKLFSTLSQPGSALGCVTESIRERIGYSPCVIHAPSHDSASAVVGAPVGPDSLFLSSGTWSIFGAVVDRPYKGEDAMNANLSNEAGVDGTIRLVKNLMGSWMLQRLSKETGLSFDELERAARDSSPKGIVDVSDDRFLSPQSMKSEILAALGIDDCPIGELAASVYHSLSLGYKKAAEEMERITGRTFSHIAIVGGGSKDDYLNVLTAMYTGKRVSAGPDEGTAIGNMLYQMIAAGELDRNDKNDVLSASCRIARYRRG